jgi:hypothetical protein
MKRNWTTVMSIAMCLGFITGCGQDTVGSQKQENLHHGIEPNSTSYGLFDDGLVNPTSHHQRYRRSELPADEPFFQWWYFTIKDLEKNRYFAFSYSVNDCVNDLTNEGSFFMGAMVDQSLSTSFHKAEGFSFDDFLVENDFDISLQNSGASDFRIEVIDDDTYHLIGVMGSPSNIWYAEGKYNGEPVDPALYIEWDLVVHRIHGWYGQQPPTEGGIDQMGVIHWNTYSHNSEVEGQIKIGDQVYHFERNERFRAYCDMNWGIDFPHGEPAIEYPWGWYYAGLPSSNPAEDISIIAGIGIVDTGSLFGIVEGKYADVRIGDTHIGIRSNETWKPSPGKSGHPLFETSNDGFVDFSVERSNWVEFQDSIGTALIPLNQKVYLESDHYIVELDFHSKIEEYNRLMFAHEYYIFSDFEGLGSAVHVTITKHTRTYKWWDALHVNPTHHYEILYDFWSDDGGIEYGYKTEDN